MQLVGHELAAGWLIGLGAFCSVHAVALSVFTHTPIGRQTGHGFELGLTLVSFGLSGLLANADAVLNAADRTRLGLALLYLAIFCFWPMLTGNRHLPLRWLAAGGTFVTLFAPVPWPERFAGAMLAVGLFELVRTFRFVRRMAGEAWFSAAGALLLLPPLLDSVWSPFSSLWIQSVTWLGGFGLGVLHAAFTARRLAEAVRTAQRFERQINDGTKTLSYLTHDLRAPVASIRGYLEALRDGVVRHPRRQYRYIRRSLLRLSELECLIDNLLAWTKLGENRAPPRTVPVDARRLLRDAGRRFESDAAVRGVALRFAGRPTDPPLPVEVDPEQIRRTLDNLLSNALRFTPAGGTITLEAEETGGCVVLKVSDTGPGIPPEELPHIFDRFYTSGRSGVGLGLAIAKEIVERHGGRIAAEANIPRGAVFVVTLPLRRPPGE